MNDRPIAEMRVLSIKTLYPTAYDLAKAWRSDAILNSADAAFQPMTHLGELSASFTFRAPSDPKLWLIVWINENQGEHQTTSEEGIYGSERPIGDHINLSEISLDSQEALNEILAYGGAIFIEDHSEILWPLSLNLRYEQLFSSQGSILWFVNFQEIPTRESKKISLNAITGEIIE